MSYTNYLRNLRRLDREWQFRRQRLQKARALVDSLPPDYPNPPDLSDMEAEETAAHEAYAAHAALEPDLSSEYADRAELADAVAAIRRLERTLGLLLTAPDPVTGPDPLPRLAEAVARATAARDALVREASAIDAQYQASIDSPERNWLAVDVLEAQSAKLRDRIGTAESKLANAERRHREAITKTQQAEARQRRHAADIELTRIELDRAREYAETLRARLPAEARAPLVETRARHAAAPAHLHPVIHERYRYEPATGTLHKRTTGQLVTAAQTVMIDGERIPRSAVIAVLQPYDPNPEDLA